MKRKHQVGCPCCCDCWDDKNFTNWTADAGSWTGTTTRATSDANAILVSDRTSVFQVLVATCVFTSQAAGDAVRFGFRNAAGDAVYVEAVVPANTNYVELKAYNHPVNEDRELIWTGPSLFTSGSASIRVLYDETYDDEESSSRFSVFRLDKYGVCQKLATELDLDQAFVGTATLDAGTTATFTLNDNYNCMCRYCEGIGATGESGGIRLGPSEFELSVSGVSCTDSGWNACVNVATVPGYETRLVGAFPVPFAGGLNWNWRCYWGFKSTTICGLSSFGFSVSIQYDSSANETTVAVVITHYGSGGQASLGQIALWKRVVSGRLDARTIDFTGANALDSDDLIDDSYCNATSATVELVASP